MSWSVALAFYRQFDAWVIAIGYMLLFGYSLWKDIRKRKQILRKQFCDFLLFLSDGLNIGYSLENALIRCSKELVPIWGEKADICRELNSLEKRMLVHQEPAQFFREFGLRCDMEEVKMFAEMLDISTKSGGNMIRIIQDVLRILRRRMDLQDDIRAVISSSLFQQKIMDYMPLMILLYIQWTAYSFVAPMYESEFGRWYMTVFLVIYAGSILLGKILQGGAEM